MLIFPMLRKALRARAVIPVLMCMQVVPLLVFPASSYLPTSQEWWLPVVLSALVVVSLVQLLVRRSLAPWPWYILSFAQGLNIISRLMMLMPHAMVNVKGNMSFNSGYVVITVCACLFSAFEIWYCDLPEVRNRMIA